MVGLKAKIKVIISILSVSLIASAMSVSAKEAKTDFVTCDAYTEFLEAKSGNIQADKCDPMTKFLIDRRNLDRAMFTLKYEGFFTKSSTYSHLTKGLSSVIYGDVARAYKNLDVAHGLLYDAFEKLDDEVRAAVYTMLVVKLKSELIKANLRNGSKLLDEYNDINIAREYGSAYEIFDSTKSDRSLMCLLKIDNVSVDFNKVLNSEAFKKCMP